MGVKIVSFLGQNKIRQACKNRTCTRMIPPGEQQPRLQRTAGACLVLSSKILQINYRPLGREGDKIESWAGGKLVKGHFCKIERTVL